MTDDLVSRRNLRHLIMRRRNERIAELRDDRFPVEILMHRETLEDLRADGDPDEYATLDFEGTVFMGIAVQAQYTEDGGPGPGEFVVAWPPPLEVPVAASDE